MMGRTRGGAGRTVEQRRTREGGQGTEWWGGQWGTEANNREWGWTAGNRDRMMGNGG